MRLLWFVTILANCALWVNAAQSPLAVSLECLRSARINKGGLYSQSILSCINHISSGNYHNGDLLVAVGTVDMIVTENQLTGLQSLSLKDSNQMDDDVSGMQVDEASKSVHSENELLFFLITWRAARAHDKLSIHILEECVKFENPSIHNHLTVLIYEHPHRYRLLQSITATLKFFPLAGDLFQFSLRPEEFVLIADVLWVGLFSAEPRRCVSEAAFYRLMQFEGMERRSFSEAHKASVRRLVSDQQLPHHWIQMIRPFG
jgi:hypothetical protein